MTMTYDVASALFGRRTDGQTQAQAGAQVSGTTVRHGTASAASKGGWVDVVLDGSTEGLTVYTELDVLEGQRVTVVTQGGVYKVVSLGAVPAGIQDAKDAADKAQTAADAAQSSATLAKQVADAAARASAEAKAAADLAKQVADDATAVVEQQKADIEDARKVATNYLSFDESTGLNVADLNADESTRGNVNIDAYGVDVRRGTDVMASFGQVTTVGKADAYHTQVDQYGVSTNDGGTRLGTLASYPGSGEFYIYGNGGVQIMSNDGSDAGASIKAGNVSVGLGGYGVKCTKPASGSMVTTMTSSGNVSMSTVSGNALVVCANGQFGVAAKTAQITASGAFGISGGTMQITGLALPEYRAQFIDGVWVTKNAGVVVVDIDRPLASALSAYATVTIGTLGAGFRPNFDAKSCLMTSSGGNALFTVRPNGEMVIYTVQYLASGVYTSGQITFHAVQ